MHLVRLVGPLVQRSPSALRGTCHTLCTWWGLLCSIPLVQWEKPAAPDAHAWAYCATFTWCIVCHTLYTLWGLLCDIHLVHWVIHTSPRAPGGACFAVFTWCIERDLPHLVHIAGTTLQTPPDALGGTFRTLCT